MQASQSFGALQAKQSQDTVLLLEVQKNGAFSHSPDCVGRPS